MFGFNPKVAKQAFEDFDAAVAATPMNPERDPMLKIVVAFIQQLAKAFS